MRAIFVLCLLCVGLWLSNGCESSEISTELSVDSTLLASGSTRYAYLLLNRIDSGFPVVSFRLSVAPDSSLTAVKFPAGWQLQYQLGDEFITWESHDLQSDLEPGQSAQFSFESTRPPRKSDFLILGINDQTGEFSASEGQVLAPTASRCNPNSYGDLDGDGNVAFSDFLILSASFGKLVESHVDGDIDCDGTVQFDDFLILSANFGKPQSGVSAQQNHH